MVAMALHERECPKCHTKFETNGMASAIIYHAMYFFCPECLEKLKGMLKYFITSNI